MTRKKLITAGDLEGAAKSLDTHHDDGLARGPQGDVVLTPLRRETCHYTSPVSPCHGGNQWASSPDSAPQVMVPSYSTSSMDTARTWGSAWCNRAHRDRASPSSPPADRQLPGGRDGLSP